MEEDVQNLYEIVVVGCGTQKKATLTESIASVDGEALEKSSSPNLGAELSGKVPGLFIDMGRAILGADTPAIQVRDINAFNNSGALVVIDGIPSREGGIARINLADIESLLVLKDASAAIYGSRATNGVIPPLKVVLRGSLQLIRNTTEVLLNKYRINLLKRTGTISYT